MNVPSSFTLPTVLLATLGLLCSCGGGSSGGTAASAASFTLSDVKYGRLLDDGTGPKVRSPLTTVEVDPISGQPVPGTLDVIDPTVNINALVSMGVGPNYLPRVVPRNGVLVLQFNHQVDPGSVKADVLNPDGSIKTRGNIQIQYQKRKGQPVQGVEVDLMVKGRQVWLNPVTDTEIGFPASPVDFGPDGEPRADATGFLRLLLDTTRDPIRTVSGEALVDREDGLGSTGSPFGFNPGNGYLDFITQNNLIPTNQTFNGYLPDSRPPRIVREHRFTDVIDASDNVGNTSVTFAGARFDVTARGGLGEWSGAYLAARPGQSDEERHAITSNTTSTVHLATPFNKRPAIGDPVGLIRAEFFEPDPGDPIDPDVFDPNNPENANNMQFVNFIEVQEIDASAEAFGPVLSLKDTIPAFSQLTVRFNEPIDRDSLGPWESFRLAPNPDLGPTWEKVTRLVLNSGQDRVSIQPVREDPGGGPLQVVGWGPGLQSLQLILTSVPSVEYLRPRLSGADLQEFLDQGIRGIRDLGGRALAFPDSLFDPNAPAIRYREPLVADEALSSQGNPPPSPDMGMILHRFQGRPITGIDPPTGNPGVKYADQKNYYWPLADVNLMVNGFLSGPAVVFLTKVHDDFFPPPDGQMGAFPFGTAFPLASFFTPAQNAPWEHNGARFQQVWRDVDASPARNSLQGTLLDLYRVSWAPIGGSVSPDTYEDISVHAGHAFVRPFTDQNGGGAVNPNFGLNEAFDFQTFYNITVSGAADCPGRMPFQSPNHYDKDYFTVVPAGTSYKVTPAALYSPPGDGNAYHPWPEFETAFQYNNGGYPQWHRDQRSQVNQDALANGMPAPWRDPRNPGDGDSLLLEIRIRPQNTAISRQNGFTFAPAILLSRFPFFRVYSVGDRGQSMNPDDIVNESRARCATPPPGAGGTMFGDNSRYFAVFDYVKTTSVITSPYVRAAGASIPQYYPATVIPPLGDVPPGTRLRIEFEGAPKSNGRNGTGFDPDVTRASGSRNLGFQATLIGSTTTLLSPSLDLVAVPFLRQ